MKSCLALSSESRIKLMYASKAMKNILLQHRRIDPIYGNYNETNNYYTYSLENQATMRVNLSDTEITDYQDPCDEARGIYIPVQDKSSYSNLQQLHKFVPQGHHLPPR